MKTGDFNTSTRRMTWKLIGNNNGGRSMASRKRALNKARRQYFKAIDNGRRPRCGYRNAMSELNFRGS